MNRLSVEHMNATLIVVFECIMMKLDSPESDAFVDIRYVFSLLLSQILL